MRDSGVHHNSHQSMATDLTSIPDHIRYGKELSFPSIASEREFLMTEGRFSCSSSFTGNTRRYHGLLVDADQIILSSLHETFNGISYLPGWWGDRPPDESLQHILSAKAYPVIQDFLFDRALVTRTISLSRGLSVRWEVDNAVDMSVRPLMTDRNLDELATEPHVLIQPAVDGFTWNGYHFRCNLPFTADSRIYYNAWYPKEASRGYDATENLASPGFFSGTVPDNFVELQIYPEHFPPPSHDSFQESPPDLLDRASRLCIRDGEIMTGHHWFTHSWGRDTFISMPGLLFAYGRHRQAEDIFRNFLRHRKGGLIPNRLPYSYNSSDATLWLFWALFHYLQTQQNSPFVDEIIPDLENLIMTYPETEVTHMERDLISVAPCSTWMDTSYTPREGQPVEINALWILALELCEYLDIGVPVSPKQVRRSFSSFWNEKSGCLYDVLNPHDSSVRPNQLIALALGLMPFDEGRLALNRIKKDLLTPYGMRSLAPDSPDYFGTYAGDQSYHNGMVWPWLISWYTDALIQYGETPQYASRTLRPLWHYLFTDGAGMLPELFNGNSPYSPAGAVCQARSIAELIRARNLVLSSFNRDPPGELVS